MTNQANPATIGHPKVNRQEHRPTSNCLRLNIHLSRAALVSLIIFSITVLSGCTARGSTATLAKQWVNSQANKGMPIGIIYEWKRASNQEAIHTSSMFVKISDNTLTFYGSTERDPFGGFARCGGYPCHLKEAGQIGVVELKPEEESFSVVRAEGNAGFLIGASCRFETHELPDNDILQCESQSGPYAQETSTPIDIKSTVNFVQPPG
jgi:hypothetical protein